MITQKGGEGNLLLLKTLNLNMNKLEHVQATKTEPNFSILKIDYIKKVNTPF
jgi:hypothetical protein